MLYDDYASKMKKLANGKNFIIRHRILITIITSIVVVLTSVFLATRGTLLGDISISNEITYGDELNYEAKALFSKIICYEFKEENSDEWTTKEPSYIGNYEIRAKVNKAFSKAYTKPYAFSIVKRSLDIEINEDEIVYGEYPTYTQRGLALNDSIEALEFIFDDLTVNKTIVNPSLASLKIYNSNDIDVTECYSITANQKELEFKKREISISPEFISTVYDGIGVSYNNSYIITSPNSLGYSDILEIKTVITDQSGNIVDRAILPGIYTNTISVASITNNGLDVSANYNIKTITNTLEIKKRPITVVTASKEKTYDGIALSSKEFNLSANTQASMLQGHRLVVDEANIPSILYYTENGIQNTLSLNVFDSNNNDITSLYDISYEYGSLKINKRNITIETGSSIREYDGSYLSNDSIYLQSGNTLPLNDTLAIKTAILPSIKNKGAIENIIDVVVMSNDKDVSSSYNILYSYGTLSVVPRKIEIKPLTINDYIYDGSNPIYPSGINNYSLINGSLVNDEKMEISVDIINTNGGLLADAGAYNVSGAGYNIINGLNENYEIIFTDKTVFNILKRDVIINPINQQAIFYEEYSYPENGYYSYHLNDRNELLEGLINHDSINVSVKYLQNNTDIIPFNAGVYQIKLIDYSFTNGNSNNYNIILSGESEFIINKRSITISPRNQDSIIYSNTIYNYPNDEYVITMDNNKPAMLYSLHTNDNLLLEVDIYNSNNILTNAKNAGLYNIYAANVATSTDVLNNYDITLSNNPISFEILKRDLTIEAVNQNNIVYDGNYYNYPSNQYVIVSDNFEECYKTELSDGASFNVEASYYYSKDTSNDYGVILPEDVLLPDLDLNINVMPKNVGKYDIYITNVSGDLDNYNITYSLNPASLEIIKRNITIKPKNQGSIVYDGNEFIYPSAQYEIIKDNNQAVSQNRLIDGSEITIDVEYKDIYNNIVSPINAKEYRIFIKNVLGDRLFYKNYNVELSTEYSTLEILQRDITIKPIYLEPVVYSNTQYTYPANSVNIISDNNISCNRNEIINELRINVMFMQSGVEVMPINAGMYEMKAIGYEASASFEGNYNITISNDIVYFNILRRDVVIQAKAQESVVYDGLEYIYPSNEYIVVYDNGIKVNSNSLIDNTPLEIAAVFKNSSGNIVSPINAGTYYIYATGVATLANYNIEYANEGVEFKINKRSVVLRANTINDVIYGEDVVYNPNDFIVEYDNGVLVNNTALIDNSLIAINVFYLNANEGYYITSPVNAGLYYINILNVEADNLVFNNYDISYSDALVSFRITPREVTISAVSPSDKIFDNQAFIYDSLSYEIYDEVDKKYNNSLINKESLSISVIYKQNGVIADPIHVGSYLIYPSSYEADELTNKNYDINLSTIGVAFNIVKRAVTIAPKSLEAVTYSNEVFIYPQNEFVVINDNGNIAYNNSLIDNTALSVNVEFMDAYYNVVSPKDAATYIMRITDHTVINTEYDDYDISYSLDDVYFTINKKLVRIKPYADMESQVFDGNTMDYTKDKYTYVNLEDRFIGNDDITIKTYVVGNPIHVGKHNVYLDSSSISFITGNYNNYNIILLDGVLEITPRPIVIAPIKQADKVYDGSLYTYPSNQFMIINDNGNPSNMTSLINNEELKLYVGYKNYSNDIVNPINANTYYMFASSYTAESQVYVDYDITLSSELIEFIILRREVELAIKPQNSIVYNNEQYIYPKNEYVVISDNGNTVYNNSLIDNSELEIEVVFKNLNNEAIAPINAGTYYMYINSYSFMDNSKAKNYNITLDTNSIEFNILKRNVELKAADVNPITYNAKEYVYDNEKYVVVSDNGNIVNSNKLIGNDYLSVNVKYISLDTNLEAKPLNAGSYGILIESHNANELTNNNYNFSYSLAPSILVINKLDIAIMPNISGSIGIFDGSVKDIPAITWKYVDYDDLNEFDKECYGNRLLSNDSLSMDARILNDLILLNAGSYTIALDSSTCVFTGGNIDSSINNYNIIYYTSEITIEKASITIEAVEPMDKLYDSYEYEYCKEYRITKLNGNIANIYNELLNNEIIKLNVRYINADNNGNIIYDGNSYSYLDNAPIDAGIYYLHAYSISTNDLTVNNNYDIEFSNNLYSFEIKKRALMLAPLEYSKNYDGNEFVYSFNSYEVINEYSDSLISRHKISVEVYYIDSLGNLYGNSYNSNPINADKYLILFENVVITDNNQIDVTDNYEILPYTNNDRYLTIEKLDVVVQALSQSKESYDGEAFIYPSADYDNLYTGTEDNKYILGVNVVSGKLVKNHSIVLKLRYYDLANNEYVVDEYLNYASPANAGEYRIEIYSHELLNATNNNYNIIYDDSNNPVLTINPRDIYYRAYQPALTYNFEVQSINPVYRFDTASGFSEDDNGLVGSDSFTAGYTVTDNNLLLKVIKDAGRYYINTDLSTVVFTEGLEANYNLHIAQGSFNVNKLAISLEYAGGGKTYDNKAIEIDGYNDFRVINNSTLEVIDRLEFNVITFTISYNDEAINLNSCLNAGKYSIKGKNVNITNDLAENFTISYKANDYIILKADLYVEFNSYSYTYKGSSYEYDFVNTRVISGNIADNQIIKVYPKLELLNSATSLILYSNKNELPVHTGEYLISYYSYEQYDQFGYLEDDQMINYNIISTSNGLYEITPANISISTEDKVFIYNGSSFTYDNSFSKDYGLVNVDSDTFKFNVYYIDSLGNIVVDQFGNYKAPSDNGIYQIRIDMNTVKLYQNGVRSSFNDYIISEDILGVGMLVIEGMPIDITIDTETIVSYGDSIAINHTALSDNEDLPEGYSINLIYQYRDINTLEIVEPINVGAYIAEAIDYEIIYNGIIMPRDNYSVNIANTGNIGVEIIKRGLYINGINYEDTYCNCEYVLPLKPYSISGIKYDDLNYLNISCDVYLNGVKDAIILDANTYELVYSYEFTKDVLNNNYDVIINNSTYVINPLALMVSLNLSGSKLYDGASLLADDSWSYYPNSSLPFDNHEISLSFAYEIESGVNAGIYDEINNAGEYIIYVNDFEVSGTSKNNYNVETVVKGGYTVEPRQITIKTGSLTTYFTGEDVSKTDEFILSDSSKHSLVEGHLIQWDNSAPTIVKKNTVSENGVNNKLGAIIYYYDNSLNIINTSSNYKITYEYGRIIVKPRPITLISGSKSAEYQGSKSSFILSCTDFEVYEDNYEFDLPSLISGHEISVSSYTKVLEYTGEPVDNVLGYKIKNEDSSDVTACYSITHVYGELFLTQAKKVFIPNDVLASDGLLYNGSSYVITNYLDLNTELLAGGDYISLESGFEYVMVKNQLGEDIEPVVYDSLVNAGTYEIRYNDLVILSKSGNKDVSSCYDIEYYSRASTFVINPLVVTGETYSKSKTWNGEDLYNAQFRWDHDADYFSSEDDVANGLCDGIISTGLIKGHYIYIDEMTVIPAYDELGNKLLEAELRNVLKFGIRDSLGINFTSNYIFEFNYGTLRVTNDIEIATHLSSESFQKPYDGIEVDIFEVFAGKQFSTSSENVTYSITPIGAYLDASFTTPATIKDLGTYYIKVDEESLAIYMNGIRMSSEDVAALNITLSEFRYNIYERTIALRPRDLSVTYDGNLHGCTPEEFSDGINYEVLAGEYIDEIGGAVLYDLLDGHYAVIETYIEPLLFTASTKSNNYITSVMILDELGNDVTHYYYIYHSPKQFSKKLNQKKFYSSLTVGKIVLEYSTGSASKVYDGTAIYNDEIVFTNEEVLLENHKIVVTSQGLTATNYSSANGILNKVKFDIIDTTTNKSVKKYYDTTSKADYGRLIIIKRDITIKTASATKVYDGTALTCSDYEITGELVDGQIITFEVIGSVIYANDPTENKISTPKITSADGSTNYTKNYNIIKDLGILLVTTRIS